MRAFALSYSVLFWHAFFLKESGWGVDLGRKGDEGKLGVVKGRKLWLEVIV